jgi:hypothetical protein
MWRSGWADYTASKFNRDTIMRTLFVALMVLAASVMPAMAYDTPAALLEAIYAPYTSADFDWSEWEPSTFQSEGLNALFAKADEETPDDEVGRIDFDPYINAQDYDIAGLEIGEAKVDGDGATVEVLFVNFDLPQHMTFSLVEEADGWKVDDVESHDADYPYSLRALLEAPLPQ